jgi:hypothetical protein
MRGIGCVRYRLFACRARPAAGNEPTAPTLSHDGYRRPEIIELGSQLRSSYPATLLRASDMLGLSTTAQLLGVG